MVIILGADLSNIQLTSKLINKVIFLLFVIDVCSEYDGLFF